MTLSTLEVSLLTLLDKHGPMTFHELAGNAKSPFRDVSLAIDRMKRGGLVIVIRDPWVHLTVEGQGALSR
jgi:predicted transcriptional regulator